MLKRAQRSTAAASHISPGGPEMQTDTKRRRTPEPAKSVTARGAKLRAERAARGLRRCEVWARPEHHEAIKAFARELAGGAD